MGKKDQNSSQEEFYRLSVDKAFEKLKARKEGLSSNEAKQRQDKNGLNQLREKKEKSLWRLVLDQLNNPIIYLLLAAVVVSFIFNDIPEAIAIIVVIILNTVIGFWMEYQARESVNALKKLDKLTVHVKRDGKTSEIDAVNLVPGDIITLESGDLVPADARIFDASELKVDESPLTGESVPVEKSSGTIEEEKVLAGQSNMLFKGTVLTSGKASAVVTAIGVETEIGKVSEMVNEADEEEIPLNKKLSKLSHNLIYVILGLAVAFFIFGWLAGKELYLLLQTSIAWTVAAIPEGLPIVASIALARGMLRLAKQNVIVKKLEAVETLGETTVIFTDKTGTLTENQLSVSYIEYSGKQLEASFKGSSVSIDPDDFDREGNFGHLFNISVFCNDAEWLDEDDFKGDPLDASLLKFASLFDKENYDDLTNAERVHEDPFDSDAKFMGTIHKKGEKLYVAGKGAAEPIMERSTHILEDGEIKDFNDEQKKEWLNKNNELSEKGLRIIAFAYREEELKQKEELQSKEDFVDQMVFVGYVGFIDPAREEIKPAMEKCHQAGIEVVMVTGDHPGIAQNIAGKVDLAVEEDEEVLEGKELESNEGKISDTRLFARVDPKQKLDIVEHYKQKGEITAMTGDGVNDAPALKKADIGIAMGDKGTQAAQEVADMVLKDDAFPSIVEAIEQGRIIFGNIRKFIIYQLSYHLAEIIIIAGISFTLFYLPLLPLQLLFLNLLSDVFPALALGLGKGDATIMQQKPKDPEEPIITRRNWMTTFVYGGIIAFIVTGAYLFSYFVWNESKEMANTVTFFSLAVAQLLHVFNMRDYKEKLFDNQVTRNKYVWLALLICIVFLLLGYFVPVLRDVLSFEELALKHWGIVGASSLLVLFIGQTVKQLFKL